MMRIPLSLLLLAAAYPRGDAFSPRSIASSGSTRSVSLHQALSPIRLHATHLNYRSNATDATLQVDWNQMPLMVSSPSLEQEEEYHLLHQFPLPKELISVEEQKKAKEPMSDVVKARLLLLASAALYGTNFSLVKILGETGMSVGLSSTLRFGMAAFATLPWLLSLENPEADKGKRFQRLFDPTSTEFRSAMGGLEVGMWNSIGYVAQAVGLETTSASKSAFLCSLAVVIVPILDYMAGKKLLSRQVIGALLAVVGVGFLELEGTGTGGLAMQSLSPGEIASLVQPLAFGLGFWRMEAAMSKYPEEADRATAAQLLAVFLGSGAYMMAMGVADPSTLPAMDQFVSWITDPTILGALFWTGVVTTALTIYMETVALKTLSAAETTLIFSTEPLWGTAFASVVMGETLGLNAAAGAVMILSGCVYSNLGVKGLLSFVPGFNTKNRDVQAMEQVANHEIAQFELGGGQNLLPTGRLGRFSLKSAVAGAMTGVVAAVESATGAAAAPTATPIPEELQEFLENLP